MGGLADSGRDVTAVFGELQPVAQAIGKAFSTVATGFRDLGILALENLDRILITADWVREYWKDAQRAMETEPFFIAWRPSSFGEVGYCMIDENVPPSNMGVVNYMTVRLNVRGYGYE